MYLSGNISNFVYGYYYVHDAYIFGQSDIAEYLVYIISRNTVGSPQCWRLTDRLSRCGRFLYGFGIPAGDHKTQGTLFRELEMGKNDEKRESRRKAELYMLRDTRYTSRKTPGGGEKGRHL